MLLLFVDDIVYPSDNSQGEDVNEALPSDGKLHFKDLKAVFFRKTESNELGKNGQLKNYPVFSRTNMHVSTAEHLTCKPVEQLEDKHAKEREMTEILQSANDKVHRNNILTIAEGCELKYCIRSREPRPYTIGAVVLEFSLVTVPL